MCGILGFTHDDRAALQAGLGILAHRGPDAEGMAVTEGVSLGHRRLSIIDLQEASNQPMRRGPISLIFNGEIYNFQELKAELIRLGHEFFTSGDTEVILEGYKAYGTEIFSKLRGMWALALVDTERQRLILSRDHFGIKPLYYAIIGQECCFSSEIKGLLPLLPSVQPHATAYDQFFMLGYTLAPETCYQGIHKLEPGEVLEWDLRAKRVHNKRRISLNLVPASADLTFAEAAEVVDEALRESVHAHYLADVPVGLLLSGGNDSSLLAAVSRLLGKEPNLFHLAVQGSTDTYYATQVAKHLGLPLTSLPMDEAALQQQYSKVWEFLDEPTGDTSMIPTSLVYSSIKGLDKVVLSGEGGDELFGGYLRHQVLRSFNRSGEYSHLVQALDWVGSGTSNVAMSSLNPLVNKLQRMLIQKGMTQDLVSAYLKQVRIVDHPYQASRLHAYLQDFLSRSEVARWTPPSLFFDLWVYLPNNLMYKNDICSMASSIEARVPFLDRRFLATVIERVPAKYLLSSKYSSKALLKKVMERYLPNELIYRDKRGFGFSPTKYSATALRQDVPQALAFHQRHAEAFGITKPHIGLFDPRKAMLLLKKYPRFAFALVSNWKVWSKRR